MFGQAAKKRNCKMILRKIKKSINEINKSQKQTKSTNLNNMIVYIGYSQGYP